MGLDPPLLLLASRAGPPPEQLAAMSEEDWRLLGQQAAQHRLGPLLHRQWAGGEIGQLIPARLREAWQTDYRESGLRALAQRAELIACTALLERSGIKVVALKGAWLAWHAYPEPAMRPMRDLDLLVPREQARAALRLLQQEGYTFMTQPDLPIEAIEGVEKHYPALISPRGEPVELHWRSWETQQVAGQGMPGSIDDALLARARPGGAEDCLTYPVPQDMLVHLVVHAAYSHKFDNGPLLLADLDYLIGTGAIDWQEFWETAARHRFSRGAALTLALVDRWRLPGLLQDSDCPVCVPLRQIEDAAGLIQQDLASRRSVGVLKSLLATDRLSTLADRIAARRGGNRRDLSGEGGFAGWAADRLRRTVREALSGRNRANAGRAVRLERWLSS